MTEEYLKGLKEAKSKIVSRYQVKQEHNCENSKKLADEIVNLVLSTIESYDIEKEEFNVNAIFTEKMGMVIGMPESTEVGIEKDGSDEMGYIRAKYMIDSKNSFKNEEIEYMGLPDFLASESFPINFKLLNKILSENEIYIAYPNSEYNYLEISFDASMLLRNIRIIKDNIDEDAKQKVLKGINKIKEEV